MKDNYSLKLNKSSFSFSAAHFLIFSNKTRELLHGHNYRITLEAKGHKQKDGMIFDFLKLENILIQLCNNLDHKTILPIGNRFLSIETKNQKTIVNYNDDEFVFPVADTILLDMDNTSAENLAYYFHDSISYLLKENYQFAFDSMKVSIEEVSGFWGIYSTPSP